MSSIQIKDGCDSGGDSTAAVAGGGGSRSRRSGSRSSEAICIVYILYVHMHMIITFRDCGDHIYLAFVCHLIYNLNKYNIGILRGP